jgi:DNA-directed RNA polymerase
MPNLVHSLDAASLAIVIDTYFSMKNNKNFYSIHDCFAVPCNKMSLTINLLKSAYLIIYSKRKYLLDFDANFINSIKKHYGEDAVSIDKLKKKMTIQIGSDSIKLDYTPVNDFLDSKLSKINVSESAYILH